MRERDDFDLLREYAEHGSQAAFAEVVRRHVDLVYSAALRRVHDRHAAEDVSQVVFIILARKARRLKRSASLPAWLLGVTRLAANDSLKSEARRRRREAAAARERSEMTARGTPPTSFNDVAPDVTHQRGASAAGADLDAVIDDALAKLSDAARAAIVLRFFEGKSFREVGERLGISEEAAKQRVFRGLERLRAALGRLGTRTSAESLALALSAIAVLPAPAAFAGTAAAVATSAAAAAQHAAAVNAVTALMTWAKAKTAAAAVAAVLLAASGGAAVVTFATRAREHVVAPPPPPTVAAAAQGGLSSGGSSSARWRGPVTGIVRTPDGRPVAGATVQLVPMNRTVLVYGQTDGVTTTRTSPDGRFTLATAGEPAAVIIRSPDVIGIGVVQTPDAPVNVTAQTWGRIEGVVLAGGKPVANGDLFLWQPVIGDDVDRSRWVDRNAYVRSDVQGRFVVERVLPGDTRIDVRECGVIRRAFQYIVEPGQTVRATVGEAGRRLVGRVRPALPATNFRSGELRPRSRRLPGPNSYLYSFAVAANGMFNTHDIPPGEYDLTVRLGEAEPDGSLIDEVARGSLQITVPAVPENSVNEPFDTGEIELSPASGLALGQEVPAIVGEDLGGDRISLADFRGRHVLLHLSPARPKDDGRLMNVLHDRLAGPDLTMVTAFVSAPDGNVISSQPGSSYHAGWPHILPLGDATLPVELAESRARLLLIDPDGGLLARALVRPAALDTLPRALAASRDTAVAAAAAATVTFERIPRGRAQAETPYSRVPPPRLDDTARRATFAVVDGVLRDQGGAGGLERLHDGRLQPHEDSPAQSGFFEWNTLEGRISIDLGRRVRTAAINTYSWHKDTRAAQVYNVFGSDGSGTEFDAAPRIGSDPPRFGWTKIATVDTRPPDASPCAAADVGGRYAVSITRSAPGGLGTFRYLLFEMFVTETRDNWGHTFYGEIDVVEAK